MVNDTAERKPKKGLSVAQGILYDVTDSKFMPTRKDLYSTVEPESDEVAQRITPPMSPTNSTAHGGASTTKKKERKIPFSVYRPHSTRITFLKSVYD